MDINYMLKIFPQLAIYLPITIGMAIGAMLLAIVIGAILTAGYNMKILKWIVSFYVLIFRGFPTLVIFFVVYYGIPQVLQTSSIVPAWIAATVCLAFKEGAYLSEIFRSGITSVESGQFEAGISLGLTKWVVYRKIIIPQAVRIIVPPMGNTFIGLLKETSLAFSIGVTELFGAGKLIAAENFQYFEVYIVVGIWYVILIYAYTLLQKIVEKHVNRFAT